MRIDDSDRYPAFLPGDPDRLREVGVVADDDCRVAAALKGVQQEIGGEIDVRALSSVRSTLTMALGSEASGSCAGRVTKCP